MPRSISLAEDGLIETSEFKLEDSERRAINKNAKQAAGRGSRWEKSKPNFGSRLLLEEY